MAHHIQEILAVKKTYNAILRMKYNKLPQQIKKREDVQTVFATAYAKETERQESFLNLAQKEETHTEIKKLNTALSSPKQSENCSLQIQHKGFNRLARKTELHANKITADFCCKLEKVDRLIETIKHEQIRTDNSQQIHLTQEMMSSFETGLNPQVKVFSQVAAKVDSGGELWLQQMRQRAKTAKRKQRRA